MSRLDPIPIENLTPEQKLVHAKLGSTRKGRVGGPFAIWLRIPQLADIANELTHRLREKGLLERRQFELLVMIVTRHWSARYAWSAHEPMALAAGLSPDVIAAIRGNRPPPFGGPDEKLLYDMAKELLDTMELSPATYDRMIKMFGTDRTVEAISVVGFYVMVATVLKGFDVPTANGEKPF